MKIKILILSILGALFAAPTVAASSDPYPDVVEAVLSKAGPNHISTTPLHIETVTVWDGSEREMFVFPPLIEHVGWANEWKIWFRIYTGGHSGVSLTIPDTFGYDDWIILHTEYNTDYILAESRWYEVRTVTAEGLPPQAFPSTPVDDPLILGMVRESAGVGGTGRIWLRTSVMPENDPHYPSPPDNWFGMGYEPGGGGGGGEDDANCSTGTTGGWSRWTIAGLVFVFAIPFYLAWRSRRASRTWRKHRAEKRKNARALKAGYEQRRQDLEETYLRDRRADFESTLLRGHQARK